MSSRNSNGMNRRARPPRSRPERLARRALHRIAAVRKQQGISSRTAARQLGSDLRKVREQEDENSDLSLSELYDWQRVLDVPIADLLVEPGTPLSQPVQLRAQLVRVMKTALSIREKSTSPNVVRMADTLIQQLIEMMPELAEVSPWHSVGHRRSLDEYGRVVERRMPDDVFCLRGFD